eukprot:2262493-Rhodomonas_salina.1
MIADEKLLVLEVLQCSKRVPTRRPGHDNGTGVPPAAAHDLPSVQERSKPEFQVPGSLQALTSAGPPRYPVLIPRGPQAYRNGRSRNSRPGVHRLVTNWY